MGIGTYDVSQLYNHMAEATFAKYKESQMLEDAISYVLFEALAIEAFINFQGEQSYKDKEYFREKIERVHPTLKKLDTITRHIVKQDFPEGTLRDWIDVLFRMRNELAHAKPHYTEFDLDAAAKLPPKEFLRVTQGEFRCFHEPTSTYFTIDEVVKCTEKLYFEFQVRFIEFTRKVRLGILRDEPDEPKYYEAANESIED